MMVSELIAILQKYPATMQVKIATIDGNGNCHEDITVRQIPTYTLSIATDRGCSYHEIAGPVLEIS